MSAPHINISDLDYMSTSGLDTSLCIAVAIVAAVLAFQVAFVAADSDTPTQAVAWLSVAALFAAACVAGVLRTEESMNKNGDAERRQNEANVAVIKKAFPDVKATISVQRCVRKAAVLEKDCHVKRLRGDRAEVITFKRFGSNVIYTIKSEKVGS